MAPRQRNIPASSPTSLESDEDSSSVDGVSSSTKSLLQQEKSRSNNTKATTITTMKPQKTLNVTESDIARDHHDYFNIVALALVVVACGLNHEFPSGKYTGDYFWTMWAVSYVVIILSLRSISTSTSISISISISSKLCHVELYCTLLCF